MDSPHGLLVERDGAVARLTLNRPQARNAFNAQLVAELAAACAQLAGDPPRLALLAGNGPIFCAGADLTWMAEMAQKSREANYADALALADMLAALDALPCPVLARVQGGAYGGGVGLLACCDAAVAADDAQFSLGEVRFGLSPATIAPYVVAKTGLSAARELMLSGARFEAPRALEIGLVHEVIPAPDLDRAVERRIAEYMACAPQAVAETKRLLRSLHNVGQHREQTTKLIAELRASAEGREGVSAFLGKRKPSWHR